MAAGIALYKIDMQPGRFAIKHDTADRIAAEVILSFRFNVN